MFLFYRRHFDRRHFDICCQNCRHFDRPHFDRRDFDLDLANASDCNLDGHCLCFKRMSATNIKYIY